MEIILELKVIFNQIRIKEICLLIRDLLTAKYTHLSFSSFAWVNAYYDKILRSSTL